MHLHDLQLFIALAHAGSLTGAARARGLTPAAASAALQRMEGSLGARLVIRTTRSLRLTPAGTRFLRTCEDVLAAWERGQAALTDERDTLAGPVRVTAPADIGALWVGPWVGDFAAAHPAVRVHLTVSDRVQDVAREEVDIAIRVGALEDSSWVARRIGRSARIAVAAPRYVEAAGTPAHPAALRGHRCLVWEANGQPLTHWRFRHGDGRVESVGVEPALCGDGALVRAWAVQGLGVAYKSRLDVSGDLAAGRLVQVLPDWTGDPAPIHAVLPGGRSPPARVEALLTWLITRFEALSPP